ncbi:MAG: acyl-CoA dehydrogenase family protein [Myxococcota bacterium]
MDFGLSEEQELLQETVRGFAQNECPTTRLRSSSTRARGTTRRSGRGSSRWGSRGLIVPEEQGGAGMELLDLALVAELLGEFAVPGPFLGHSLAALGVTLVADPAQREAILPGLADGSQIATVALQESAFGFAPGEWIAKIEGDRVSGTKAIVPSAGQADRFLVGLQGGRLAWVDAKGEGVRIEPVEGVDRTRPISTVHFAGAPASLLGGDEASAWRLLDAASVLLAADAFGAASKLIDLDVAYSLSREQFGQPIAQFQAIKHTIARIATDIEPARALFWYAAHAWDHLPEESARAASVAKAHLTDRAMDAARQSVELHGGYGFTWECEVQMWFKRIMFDRSCLGTPDRHRERTAELGGY